MHPGLWGGPLALLLPIRGVQGSRLRCRELIAVGAVLGCCMWAGSCGGGPKALEKILEILVVHAL